MDRPDPTEQRDRLLSALIALDPDAVLLHWDAEIAVVRCAAEVVHVHFVTVPDLPRDRLEYLFSAHVRGLPDGAPPTLFVMVGGGADAQPALRDVSRLTRADRAGFYHFDEGRFAHVTGKELSILGRAAAELPEGPIDPAPLADALRRGQALIEADRAAARKLQGRYPVTVLIGGACIALAVIAQVWDPVTRSERLLRLGANNGVLVLAGGVHRLFAYAFLHMNVMHLAMNMMVLWSMGPLLEVILGSRRFVILYGAATLGSALASAFPLGMRWSVGASGAIWGLMGAFFAIARRPNGLLPPAVSAGMKSRIASTLVLNLVISFLPGVDMRAHLGGGIVGFVLMATVLGKGLVPVEQRKDPNEAEATKSPLVGALAGIFSAAMVASVIYGLALGAR